MNYLLLGLLACSVGLVAACGGTPGLARGGADFAFAEIAEAHLSGQVFERRSVRISATGTTQIVRHTSDGVLLSIAAGSAGTPPGTALPPAARPDAGAPPLVSSGRGAVGVAARQDGGRLSLEDYETTDPGVTSAPEAISAYKALLDGAAGATATAAIGGRYVQLRALSAAPAVAPDPAITDTLRAASPALAAASAAPFAYIPVAGDDPLSPWVSGTAPGRFNIVALDGQAYALVVFATREAG
ncbi:MAG: hypothetical protein AAF281_00350 [Pseudomonadota bacterium]